MTKKEFKTLCSFHEYGKGKTKRIAIYFDWKTGKSTSSFFAGFKFMVKASIKDMKREELFNELYNWVHEKTPCVPWYVNYKFAACDNDRFKVSLMG